MFDPDGDLVDFLHATGRACRHPTWACYHTVLDTFVQDEIEYGISQSEQAASPFLAALRARKGPWGRA